MREGKTNYNLDTICIARREDERDRVLWYYCKEEICGYETRNISKLACIDWLMTVQRLVWCGLETGAVSRGLSKPVLAISYAFVLLQMIQLVMGDYK